MDLEVKRKMGASKIKNQIIILFGEKYQAY